MSPELDAKLCADFPLLHSARRADTHHTLSYVGFETGDGWFDIIYELSAELERLIKTLYPEERNNYYAVQVKEKFGLLNFYMSKTTKEMCLSIGKAEGKSASTCEECGQPGKLGLFQRPPYRRAPSPSKA